LARRLAIGRAAAIAACLVVVPGTAAAPTATFMVTNTGDSGPGSLREALTAANTTAGKDSIAFSIPGAGPHTIAVTTGALPPVTDPIVIDGRTEPGYAGAPLIRVDNATGDSTIAGIDVAAGSSEFFGLAVTRFSRGVEFRSPGGNTLAASWIGLDAAGNAAPNRVGVSILNGSNGNLVGGSSSAARNLISGNSWVGVEISGPLTTGNAIKGNYIGTSATGSAAIPNELNGVWILGGARNTIVGGTSPPEGNLISGNAWAGVGISGSGTSGNLVQGNSIGTNPLGNASVANGQNGVMIFDGAATNTIGGTSAGARNLISGNGWTGVELSEAGTNRNVVQGNYVGTTASGETALSNGAFGVALFFGPSENVIGGTTAGARNVLSGNFETGVALVGAGTVGNAVLGNRIGTNPAGTQPVGNQFGGVRISGPVVGTRIGGVEAGARNVISANGGDGIQIGDRASETLVQGNYIGTDAAGSADLGNVQSGIVMSLEVTETTIGGTTAAARNVISGNGGAGVRVFGPQTSGNLFAGNYIGTNAAGTQAIGNGSHGVVLSGASGNTVGGSVAGSRNTIAFNAGDGVRIDGTSGATNGDSILGNSIFSNGALGIALVGGGNNAQPAPTITSVARTGRKTTVKGTLAGSAPASQHRIEVFVSPTCDGSGAGEGKKFYKAATVVTNANGDAPFSVKGKKIAAGQTVTATATNLASGDTSAFSLCVTA
jgi:titin